MSSNIAFIKPSLRTGDLTDTQLEFVGVIVCKFIIVHEKSKGKFPIGWTYKELVLLQRRVSNEENKRKKEAEKYGSRRNRI